MAREKGTDENNPNAYITGITDCEIKFKFIFQPTACAIPKKVA
jgi:hypothetical protein